MGNLYRFVEPVLLFLLMRKRGSYGYELAGELRKFALTDAEIEVAALYRTLRQLEQNGCVTSKWDVDHAGPARRVYALTRKGEQHLDEWVAVLDHMSHAMARFVTASRLLANESSPARRPNREPEARQAEAGRTA